jgi:SAM-dependent methyltransferase
VIEAKFEWLLAHLQCPACRARDFSLSFTHLVCARCGQDFRVQNDVIDFIDPKTVATFGLVETENVSDHPFDENALTIIDRCRQSKGMVLDCGSGYKSVGFENVIQMEIVRFPNVDILAVNQRIPFQDSTFDAVFSLDVLEHVTDPFACASEIVRVLKPGGYLYFNMPFLQAEHGYPYHYFNATRMGVCRLFDSLECVGHIVPASGAPMFTLHHLLHVYVDSLPDDLRDRFQALRVGDILSKSPLEWLDDPLVEKLRYENRWQIASATQAMFRKPPVSGEDDTTSSLVLPDLPGFGSLQEMPD